MRTPFSLLGIALLGLVGCASTPDGSPGLGGPELADGPDASEDTVSPTSPENGSFTIEVSPTCQVLPGGTLDVVVKVSRKNEFQGRIVFTLANVPAGLSTANASNSGDATTTLSLKATSDASLGNFVTKIVATSGATVASASTKLHIGDKPGTVNPALGPPNIYQGSPEQTGIVVDANNALLAQPDGKFLTLRTTTLAGTSVSALALERHLKTGMPDPSFGTQGKIAWQASSSNGYLASGPKGTIYVADGVPFSSSSNSLRRFNADGSLDTSFGTGGKVTLVQKLITAIAVDTSGAAYVGGTQNAKAWLTRVTPAGAVDTAFGTGGVVQPSGEAIGDLVVQSDDKLLFVNAENSKRYDSHGTPDPGFTSAGAADFLMAAAVLQPDGKILGVSGYSADATIRRFTPTGGLDGSFAKGGVSAPFPVTGLNSLKRLALHPDGSMYITIEQGQTLYLEHVLADGTLDEAWGAGKGYVQVAHAQTASDYLYFSGLTIDAQGAVLVSAVIPVVTAGSNVTKGMVLRYWP